jgi:hypothetical protein
VAPSISTRLALNNINGVSTHEQRTAGLVLLGVGPGRAPRGAVAGRHRRCGNGAVRDPQVQRDAAGRAGAQVGGEGAACLVQVFRRGDFLRSKARRPKRQSQTTDANRTPISASQGLCPQHDQRRRPGRRRPTGGGRVHRRVRVRFWGVRWRRRRQRRRRRLRWLWRRPHLGSDQGARPADQEPGGRPDGGGDHKARHVRLRAGAAAWAGVTMQRLERLLLVSFCPCALKLTT